MRPTVLLLLSACCLPASTISTSAVCHDALAEGIVTTAPMQNGCTLAEPDNSGAAAFASVADFQVSATGLAHGAAKGPVAYTPAGYGGGPFGPGTASPGGYARAVYDADLQFTITGGVGQATADPMFIELIGGDWENATTITDVVNFGAFVFRHDATTPGQFFSDNDNIVFNFGVPFVVHVHLEASASGWVYSQCNCGGGTGTTAFQGFHIYTLDGHSYKLGLSDFDVVDVSGGPKASAPAFRSAAVIESIPTGEVATPEPTTLLMVATALALALIFWGIRTSQAVSRRLNPDAACKVDEHWRTDQPETLVDEERG